MTRHRKHMIARIVIGEIAVLDMIGLFRAAYQWPSAQWVMAAFASGLLAVLAAGAAVSAAATVARIAVETAWYRHHARPLRERHPLHPTAAPAPRRARALAVALADDDQLPALDPVAVARETAAFAAYVAGDDSILIEPPFGRWLRTGTPGRHVAAGPVADMPLRGYWADPADIGWDRAA